MLEELLCARPLAANLDFTRNAADAVHGERAFSRRGDPAAYSLLQGATSTVTDLDIHTLNSEFERAIPEILKIIGNSFSLVFIDPTGWTGFGLRQIAPILRHTPGEVLVNFMCDHINRFLDTSEPEMSFGDLFGGAGWKPVIQASPTREDAIITLYGDRMKATGTFGFVTSTRIKKPLSERSYFYLVYGTRHPEGLLEFRRVEEREILEQERVRMDAQQLDRVKRTGQAELFGTDDLSDVGPTSFEEERRENLRRAEERLVRILQGAAETRYESARAAMMEVPLVWETDVQRIVKAKADVIGMTTRERVPKPGHRLKLKSVK